jgi:hypothetical protein
LNSPDELFARVVEVELDLVVGIGGRLRTSVLELLDEVLVRDLGKTAALISIKVDVVNEKRSGTKRRKSESRNTSCAVHRRSRVELKVDLDLVVLKSDKRKSKTRVAVEPELKRNVKSGAWDAGAVLGELRNITNHVSISILVTSSLAQLVPDVEPLTIVLINLLSTNFENNVVDELVSEPVDPTELSRRNRDSRDSDLEVGTVDEITVSRDGAGDLLSEVSVTVEGLLNGLHREVGVASVDDLEESNLRVASQVNVLGTVSYKLH